MSPNRDGIRVDSIGSSVLLSDCTTAPPAGQQHKRFFCYAPAHRDERVGQQTHISPRNFRIDVRWHISTAVLLLQLSFAGDQPVLQHVRLLLELLRERQSLFQVLLPLRYLKERESMAILISYVTCKPRMFPVRT